MKRILAMLLASSMIMSLAGCAQTGTAAPASQPAAETAEAAETTDTAEAAPANYLDREPLRVGTMVHQMGVSLYTADKLGLFEKAGINVELIMFEGGAPINEAFGAGELDGAISGLASVYGLAAGLNRMVGEVDTVACDCLVVRADSDIAKVKGQIEGKPDMYGSAESIKGASFIVQVGQAAQFYALKYASQFGLGEDDINFINMEKANGTQAYMTGEGDVLVSGMPYVYDLTENSDDYIVAAWVDDATDIEIKDPILFTPDAIENRREEIKIFLQVIYGLIDEWDNDYDAYKQAVMDFYQANGKDFVEELVDYEFAKNRLLGTKEITADEYYMGDGMQSVADFYGSIGSIDAANVDVYKMYDTSLLKEALGIDVKAFSK